MIAAALLTAFATQIAQPVAVRAATITVNTTSDVISPTDGHCSLREAIIAANTNTASGVTPGECPAGTGSDTDTIVLPAGTYTLTIAGRDEDAAATGDLDIRENTIIQGSGSGVTFIQASATGRSTGIDRVFDFRAGKSSLNDLTVRYGNASTAGGGITINAGAIVFLTNVTVTTNTNADVTAVDGGGIYNAGTLTLTNSTVADNVSRGQGSGIYNGLGTLTVSGATITGNNGEDGPGISNHGNLSIASSTISNNIGGYGGGILNYGIASVTNSMITGNNAGLGSYGGGIADTGGRLSLTNVTVSGNTGAAGGGVSHTGNQPLGIVNSTISGNATTGVGVAASSGGGIYFASTNVATITNTTVSGNMAAVGGGIILDHDAGDIEATNVTVTGNSTGITRTVGTFDFLNSIVANSTAGPNCTGTIHSLDDNLSSDASCVTFTQPHDLTNLDPRLGPLTNNGGPTPTHALLAGSPAIDHAGTSAYGCPMTDQRGVSRPQGAACDSGAYEYAIGSTSPAPRLGPSVGGVPNPAPPHLPGTTGLFPALVPSPRP